MCFHVSPQRFQHHFGFRPLHRRRRRRRLRRRLRPRQRLRLRHGHDFGLVLLFHVVYFIVVLLFHVQCDLLHGQCFLLLFLFGHGQFLFHQIQRISCGIQFVHVLHFSFTRRINLCQLFPAQRRNQAGQRGSLCHIVALTLSFDRRLSFNTVHSTGCRSTGCRSSVRHHCHDFFLVPCFGPFQFVHVCFHRFRRQDFDGLSQFFPSVHGMVQPLFDLHQRFFDRFVLFRRVLFQQEGGGGGGFKKWGRQRW